ncbi:replicative DNA helicase [Vampirovibrio chlorellavorus]|uniref:replicative DNA helicase n=1 Tax=Vampirovibrio chlorellavorus TaxID=758823 RepID=UPI0026F190C7|nr:replicative DNA helicase [Vampirovibrio chlorellavorus]
MATKRNYPSNYNNAEDPGLALVESLLPPHSVEAEQSVLGGILFSPEAFNKIIELIRPDDFYRGPHKHIFEAMTELYNKSEPIDIITVSEMMSDKGVLEAAGGRPYLMDLAMSVATAENIVYYAKIIRNKGLLRSLISAGNEIASHCYETNDAEQAIDMAQQSIFQLAQHGIPNDLTHIKDILPESWEQIEERCANKGSLMGVSTGFYDLDNYTSGLQKSDLIILAARPSMGKTAFCLNIVSHVALREQRPVLVFSLEMGKEQLVLRMLCAEAEIDAQKIKTGEISEHEFPKLTQAMGKLGDAPIYIDDTPGMTVMEMRAKARKVQMESGGDLGLIVIDYLQLMQGPGGGGGTDANRTQEISAISRGLKGLARELKVPVMALSQLSRAVESRQDKKPMLSDLRESGAIEQDADLVMFIYRDEYYNKDSERPGTADIIIAKHRNGAVGEISLLFRNSITRFLNPADRKVHVF